MYDDYKESHPSPVSYETYRVRVKECNISFTHLGNEECEQCVAAKEHRSETKHNENEAGCDICLSLQEHLNRAKEARESYKQGVKVPKNPHKLIVSADLQKVLMLPRMPGIKSVMFTPRIIAFNETFAQLGPGSQKHKHFLAVWNEAEKGRNAEDIASTFWEIISSNRDVTDFIFWCDNCSAQNKNWTLFTMLITAVNDKTQATQITVKYLEAGHTFMSADSVHSQIEHSMKKNPNIYDWTDYITMLKGSSSGNVEVLDLKFSSFRSWKNKFSTSKMTKTDPRIYLKDIG